PDRGARDLEKLALVLEAVIRQCLDDDLRRLDKARPRLFHRNAEAFVFDARRATPKTEDATAAAQDVEQRYLLGDTHRIVPRQYDDCGPEADPAGSTGKIGEELRG